MEWFGKYPVLQGSQLGPGELCLYEGQGGTKMGMKITQFERNATRDAFLEFGELGQPPVFLVVKTTPPQALVIREHAFIALDAAISARKAKVGQMVFDTTWLLLANFEQSFDAINLSNGQAHFFAGDLAVAWKIPHWRIMLRTPEGTKELLSV